MIRIIKTTAKSLCILFVFAIFAITATAKIIGPDFADTSKASMAVKQYTKDYNDKLIDVQKLENVNNINGLFERLGLYGKIISVAETNKILSTHTYLFYLVLTACSLSSLIIAAGLIIDIISTNTKNIKQKPKIKQEVTKETTKPKHEFKLYIDDAEDYL